MADNFSTLTKAVRSSAPEIDHAALAVRGGCPTPEAVNTFIKSGPANVVWEFLEAHRKSGSSQGQHLLARQFDAETGMPFFRTNPNGKIVLLHVADTLPTITQPVVKPDMGAADPDERKRRANMAKTGESAVKLFKPAKALNTSVGFAPEMVTPTMPVFGGGLEILSTMVTMGVFYHMKKFYEKQASRLLT